MPETSNQQPATSNQQPADAIDQPAPIHTRYGRRLLRTRILGGNINESRYAA